MKRELQFVICVFNREYAASLELRKIYQVIPDKIAANLGLVRVIDESGEDYLYPKEFFVPVELSQAVERAVRRAKASGPGLVWFSDTVSPGLKPGSSLAA